MSVRLMQAAGSAGMCFLTELVICKCQRRDTTEIIHKSDTTNSGSNGTKRRSGDNNSRAWTDCHTNNAKSTKINITIAVIRIITRHKEKNTTKAKE